VPQTGGPLTKPETAWAEAIVIRPPEARLARAGSSALAGAYPGKTSAPPTVSWC